MKEKTADVKLEKVLDELKRISIPNTRELQQLRISSAGLIGPDGRKTSDNQIKEKDEKPRFVLFPEDEQKRVYSVSIPFSFPDGDWLTRMEDPQCPLPTSLPEEMQVLQSRRMWFEKWGSGSFSSGLNITTKQGLEELIRIFSRNNLPFELGNFHKELFYSSGTSNPSLRIPYALDGGNHLMDLEFITFDYILEACTYIVLEETKGIHNEEEISNLLDNDFRPNHKIFTKASFLTTRDVYCDITVFCSERGVEHPEYYLQERLDKEMKQRLTESAEERELYPGNLERENGRIISARASVLYIGEPAVVYDPSWINLS